MSEKERIEITVGDFPGKEIRLDQYLANYLPQELNKDFSRSQVQKLIENEFVQVNGKAAKANLLLHGGENIELSLPENKELNLTAESIPLDIIYEDEYLVVVNKAAGMVTHPGAGNYEGTLVNALLFHCKDSLSGISGVLRPGIVHRLDKDTSGLLVVAKDDKTHRVLSEHIKERLAKRSYIAVLEGTPIPPKAIVDKPIGRHQVDRKKMAVTEKGRPARTYYEVLESFDRFSLIKANLETGRTHQIRVHMSSLGYPVVGDIVYNKKTTGTQKARHELGLIGHALHAQFLSFTHPVSKVLLEFEAPIPADLQKLLDTLRGKI